MIPMKAPSKAFAVRVAFDWNGGPATALWSFASSGGRVRSQAHKDRITAGVKSAIEWVRAYNLKRSQQLPGHRGPDEFGKEEHRLNRLLEFINNAPIEE